MERAGIVLVVRIDLSITEIAFRYGYSDLSPFNKAFKRNFGVSPSLYRKARNDKQ